MLFILFFKGLFFHNQNLFDFIEIKIKRHLDNKIADIQANGRLVKFKGEESIQLVISDISTRKALAREQMRAQIAEETNLQLQREIVERKKTQTKLATTQKFNTNITIYKYYKIKCLI